MTNIQYNAAPVGLFHHEQPRRMGTIRAAMLVLGIVIVGSVIQLLHG